MVSLALRHIGLYSTIGTEHVRYIKRKQIFLPKDLLHCESNYFYKPNINDFYNFLLIKT